MMIAAVIIVVQDELHHFEECLHSILAQTHGPQHVVVVGHDGNHQLGVITAAKAAELSATETVLTILEASLDTGFTGRANHGLRFLLEHSPDIDAAILVSQYATIDPTWTESVATVFESDQQIGGVGSRIYLPNRHTVLNAGGYLERPRQVRHYYGHHLGSRSAEFATLRDVEFVTATAMALRVSAVEPVGIFNEAFASDEYADVDWCARARKSGWRIVYSPDTIATYFDFASPQQLADRLTRSHQNRLVFTLPLMVESGFRAEFLVEEQRHLTTLESEDERRSLAFAYLLFLLMLSSSTLQIPSELATPPMLEELVHAFSDLRREALVSRAERATRSFTSLAENQST